MYLEKPLLRGGLSLCCHCEPDGMKQSFKKRECLTGLLHRFTPRNDGGILKHKKIGQHFYFFLTVGKRYSRGVYMVKMYMGNIGLGNKEILGCQGHKNLYTLE